MRRILSQTLDRARAALSFSRPRMGLSPRLFLATVCILFTACTTTTGTRSSASAADIAKLQRLAVVVRGTAQFSVQRDRERMTTTGAVLGGLIGVAIESAARANSDTNL